MAVHSSFSKKDIEKMISNYELAQLKKSMNFSKGEVQSNILIETTKGKFALKYYENRSKEYVLFEVNVLNYFNKKGFPCPAPIKNVYGKFIGKYKSKPFSVFGFIEGEHVKNPNYKKYKELAKYLAKFHNISEGYKPKYWQFREGHDKKFCWEESKKEAKRFNSRNKARERLDWLKEELDKIKFPNSVPKGVCHCDYNMSNVKFKGNKLTGVLDFDDACYTYLVFDIANLIYNLAWRNEKKFDFNKAGFLLKEYTKYRKLNISEKKHLYDSLKIVVLTFLTWFFYDGGEKFYKKSKDQIDWLNNIGREEFYRKLFL